MSNNKKNSNMKKETNKINLTGTTNSSAYVIETTSTHIAKIHKFEPIQTYPIGTSSNSIICAKCGKQGWEHPNITYTQL